MNEVHNERVHAVHVMRDFLELLRTNMKHLSSLIDKALGLCGSVEGEFLSILDLLQINRRITHNGILVVDKHLAWSARTVWNMLTGDIRYKNDKI